jgi:hypothetical protein
MKEKEIKEFIQRGHILIKAIFEMAGNPKEHVEETLKKYINAIKEDPEYIFMNEYMAPAEENDDKIWSTFYEADILVSNFEKLNLLCFNLSPASIEIIEPEQMDFTQKKLTNLYNDVISKIHEISMAMKGLNSENDLLKVNINRLIRNCIILSLTEPRTIDEISLKAGIDAANLKTFLDAMIKEKTIILEDTKYRVNK